MKHQLKSSNLASVDYDHDNRTLKVEFKSGKSWTYVNVPKEHYNGLLTANSPGSYFYNHIRNVYRLDTDQ